MGGTFLLRKLGGALVTLVAIAVLNFVLFRLLPGDPITKLLPSNDSQAQKEALRARLGPDQPIFPAVVRTPAGDLAIDVSTLPDSLVHDQFVTSLTNVVTLDLGLSFAERKPVTDVILQGCAARGSRRDRRVGSAAGASLDDPQVERVGEDARTRRLEGPRHQDHVPRSVMRPGHGGRVRGARPGDRQAGDQPVGRPGFEAGQVMRALRARIMTRSGSPTNALAVAPGRPMPTAMVGRGGCGTPCAWAAPGTVPATSTTSSARTMSRTAPPPRPRRSVRA